MQSDVNEFIPQPKEGESYGGYCDRLEVAVVTITDLKEPTESAIQALAFIAMEAPADFGATVFRRIQKFLGQLPSELRAQFRAEAIKLPRGRDDRINALLNISRKR